MIDCEVVRDLLPLYADDQASDATSRLIENHIEVCPECRHLVEKMRAPLEPEIEEEEMAYLDALRRQKRKNRNRVLLACVLTAVFCLVGWWLSMEWRFQGSQVVTVSTDGKEILTEMPQLALTEEELDLADRILEIPAVQAALEKGDTQSLSLEGVEELRSVLPEDAANLDVSVVCMEGYRHIYIDYRSQGLRVILSYSDRDGGKADAISKLIGVPTSEEDWAAREMYQMHYSPALGSAWYEKTESRHTWFGFLNMP